MKNFKLLLCLFGFFVTNLSCKKINNDNFNVDPAISSFIQKFNIAKFNTQFGQNIKLDFKNSKQAELSYLGLPEKYILTPILYNDGKTYGTMYSLKINDTSYTSLVVDQNGYDLKNGNGKISYIGVGIDNTVVFSIKNYKISDLSDVSYQTNNKIKSNSNTANASNNCTSSCYKRAKDACDSDPDCKILCDNIPSCSGSITVACFMHCMFK
jgi:hypothetical protein